MTETGELPTGLGDQLRCVGGQIVVMYYFGTIVPQGKEVERVKALFAALPPPKPVKAKKPATPDLGTPVGAFAVPLEKAGMGNSAPPGGWTTEPWDRVSLPW